MWPPFVRLWTAIATSTSTLTTAASATSCRRVPAACACAGDLCAPLALHRRRRPTPLAVRRLPAWRAAPACERARPLRLLARRQGRCAAWHPPPDPPDPPPSPAPADAGGCAGRGRRGCFHQRRGRIRLPHAPGCLEDNAAGAHGQLPAALRGKLPALGGRLLEARPTWPHLHARPALSAPGRQAPQGGPPARPRSCTLLQSCAAFLCQWRDGCAPAALGLCRCG